MPIRTLGCPRQVWLACGGSRPRQVPEFACLWRCGAWFAIAGPCCLELPTIVPGVGFGVLTPSRRPTRLRPDAEGAQQDRKLFKAEVALREGVVAPTIERNVAAGSFPPAPDVGGVNAGGSGGRL